MELCGLRVSLRDMCQVEALELLGQLLHRWRLKELTLVEHYLIWLWEIELLLLLLLKLRISLMRLMPVLLLMSLIMLMMTMLMVTMLMMTMLMLIILVMSLVMLLILWNCNLSGLLLVILILIIERGQFFLKNVWNTNYLLHFFVLIQILLDSWIIIVILEILIITSLKSLNQIIIFLIVISSLAFLSIFTAASSMIIVILMFSTLFVVWELMNVARSRMVYTVVVVVAPKLIKSLLIEEIAIGIVETLVIWQYVEAHLIVETAFDLKRLFRWLLLILFLLVFLLLLILGRPFASFLSLLIRHDYFFLIFFFRATRELNFDFLATLALILLVSVSLLFRLSGILS